MANDRTIVVADLAPTYLDNENGDTVFRGGSGIDAINAMRYAASASASATNAANSATAATNSASLSLAKASNLSDLANTATARTNLGLAAVAASGSAADLSAGTLPTARMPALTGAVTSTVGSAVTTIATGAVTNSNLANVNTATFKGRTTAGIGSPEDLTGTQATALLNVFTSTLKGLVPLSGGGTVNFLRADGTWAAPPGGGSGTTTNALTMNNGGAGAASGSTFNGSAAITISYNSIGATRAGAVTAGDLTMTTARLLGRTTAATGAVEELTAGATLTLSAGSIGVASVPNSVTFAASGGAAAGSTFNGSAARTVDYSTVGASPARPTIAANRSASFTAADTDNNTHSTASGSSLAITLNSTPAAGTSFTIRFTTAWTITCTSLSKNGNATAANGSIAANSLITFLHEGSGTWLATGTGLT